MGEAVADPLGERVIDFVGIVADDDAAGADFADERDKAAVAQGGSLPVIGGEQAREPDYLGPQKSAASIPAPTDPAPTRYSDRR
ncbi:hypothetical protein [Streptomyces sp. NPDC127108]|uniref:hypothetical protein n=1 Tax=Streptomyces sp. NPDC127108 TaxID=3345361 RepID=UPI00363A4652